MDLGRAEQAVVVELQPGVGSVVVVVNLTLLREANYWVKMSVKSVSQVSQSSQPQ